MKKTNKKKSIIAGLVAMLAMVCLCGCGGNPSESSSSGDTTNITMEMSENSIVLGVGESRQLTVEVVGASGNVNWYSADETVATIDQSGLVRAVGKGETRIYAEIGEERTECIVKVEDVLSGVPNFYIDYSSLTLYKGYDFTLEAVLRVGAEEQEIDENAVSWSSDKPAVATVVNGLVEAIDLGIANITAKYTYEGTEYVDTVSVEVSSLGVLLVSVQDEMIASSKTYGGNTNSSGITTNIILSEYADNVETPITDFSSYRFTSSDNEIISVENGVITAGQKTGTANIIVERLNAVGEVVLSGNTSVTVCSAINSKYDLDMLALAYARNVHGVAWNKDAKYLLTQDIDYNGNVFLPIAASRSRLASTHLIGKQWKEILKDEATYGISYDTLATRGLNDFTDETVDNTLGVKFQATINGNGYAIKNAKLMYDASCMVDSTNTFAVTTNMIGALGKNGKIENLSVENLGIQTPAEAGYEVTTYTLDAVGKRTTQAITLPNANVRGNMIGAFGYIAGGTIEDCYIDVNFGSILFAAVQFQNYAFGWLQSGTVKNSIIKLTYNTAANNSMYGLRTTKDASGAVVGKASNFVLIEGSARGVQSGGAPEGLIYLQNESAFKTQVENGTIDAAAFTAWDTDLTDKNLFVLKSRQD